MKNLRIKNKKSPNQLGFSMPAEWESHAYTLLTWPVVEEWPCPAEEILSSYTAFIRTLLQVGEQLMLVVRPQSQAEAAQYLGAIRERITVLEAEVNDSWVRDNGPIFVTRKTAEGTVEVAGTKWGFNAWGEKYAFDKDNLLPYRIFETLDMPYFESSLILEGGSIGVDGEGTLLTTDQCLNEERRNPHKSPLEMDEEIKATLGVKKVIRLNRGLVGDHTDGHVDNVACFLKPGTILIQVPTDKADPNYASMQENLEILRNTTDAMGRKFEIIVIEPPESIVYDGESYCASYVNLYFAGNAVLVPVFGGVNAGRDEQVLSTLRVIYRGQREVVPVEGHVFPLGGGNIHCKTQQIPLGETFFPDRE